MSRLCAHAALAVLLMAAAPSCLTTPPRPPEARPLGDEAPPEQAAAPAGRPELLDLLRLALDRNPAILAAKAGARAAAEEPAAAAWLPDPKLTLGWYETPVETRTGPMDLVFGLSQEIPFPTKLAARGELARVAARREALRYERAVRDVLTEVTRSAFELSWLAEADGVARDLGALLDRYVALAARGESGSPLPELFRAETQRAQLENDRVLLRELRAVEKERLRALLDLPPGTEVGVPRPPVPPRLTLGYEELLAAALASSQELAEAGLEEEAAALRASLARQERLPDFSIGMSRIFLDDPDARPAGGGGDPLLLTAGITLPLWVPRDSARIRAAEMRERAASLGRRVAGQQVRERLARAFYRLGAAERAERLYAGVLLPRASAAARTAEDRLAAGQGTLAGALETIAVWHNFRLARARAAADRGIALAELEAVVGRPFVPEGAGR